MNHTQNPTALQSQRWIVQALLYLMQENDYDKISVTEICHKAELDRRTFYRNFKSKHDVLNQYIEQLSKDYMIEFQKIGKPDRYSATVMFFCFWRKHLSFINHIQLCGMSDFVFMKFEKFIKSHQELIVDSQDESPQIDYIFAYRIGGFWNVMLTWAANNADIPPTELAAVLNQA